MEDELGDGDGAVVELVAGVGAAEVAGVEVADVVDAEGVTGAGEAELLELVVDGLPDGPVADAPDELGDAAAVVRSSAGARVAAFSRLAQDHAVVLAVVMTNEKVPAPGTAAVTSARAQLLAVTGPVLAWGAAAAGSGAFVQVTVRSPQSLPTGRSTAPVALLLPAQQRKIARVTTSPAGITTLNRK